MRLIRYWGSKPREAVEKMLNEILGNVVIDPFGGSGEITRAACERGKRVVYSDLNPYAWLVAYVTLHGADPYKYQQAVYEVLENAEKSKTRRSLLRDDYLTYGDKPFWKKRNFNRVSQFFLPESRNKLFKLLMAVDAAEHQKDVKLALYLTFAATLYKSSLMNRSGGGSWPVPCYWAPRHSTPQDPYQAFQETAQRFTTYFKKTRPCPPEAMLLEDATSLDYSCNWALVTDPPFFDEVQYLELSFFYWAWLRESKLPQIIEELTGRRPTLRFTAELVVNPARGASHEVYLKRLKKFLRRTRCMKEKALIFHEEQPHLLRQVLNLAKKEWGKITTKTVKIDTQRRVGPRGSTKYYIITSRQ